MKQIAKEYNEQIKEETAEQSEEVKDLIEDTGTKIENLIKLQTNELKANLVSSKQRRDEELYQIQRQYENETRKIDDRMHFANKILDQNNEKLDNTTNHIMRNFESQIKDMFNKVNATLQKDEEKERERDDIIRKKELELLSKIDEKNKTINKLRSSQDDYEDEIKRRTKQEFDNTFDRDPEKSRRIHRNSRYEKTKIEEERSIQEKEITLMEVEDFRMKQIIAEEKRIKEVKKREKEEREKPKEQPQISQGELRAIEQKVQHEFETKKWQEIEEIEEKAKEKIEKLKGKLKEKNEEEDNLYM